MFLLQNLNELEIEDEKRNLIHREIDRFRDTYKVFSIMFFSFFIVFYICLFYIEIRRRKRRRKEET